MKHFLTHGMLAELYNEIDKSVVCYKKLRKMSEGASVITLCFPVDIFFTLPVLFLFAVALRTKAITLQYLPEIIGLL